MSGLTSVTVAQAAAENQLGVPFAIVDTAAAVSSAWDVLATYSNLSSISLTDTGTPTLPVSDTQYTNDAAVLGKLTGSYMLAVTDATAASAAALQADARVASFTVTDTAANIAASFDALNADTKITAIASSTGPVVITDAQYHMDTAAIAMLAQTVEVVVVNNAPVADAATLQTDQNVASFTIADTASAVAAQVSALNADTAVTSIAITDTAANIASALDALNALAPAFTITSTNGPVVITDAQYHTDLTAIAALEQTVEVLVVPDAPVADAAALQADRYVASFSIADTASAVAAQVTALNADTAVTAIAITDTAANIASALDALNALSPAFTITSTNGPVAITGTQYNTDMTAIAALEQTGGTLTVTGAATDAAALQADSNVVSFAVSDTAANIAANFDALNADTKLTSITSSTGPVVISIAQYYSDTAAITKLAQTAEVLVVNNATVADAAALQADQNVASFTIADTASAVAAQVTALNADTALTAIAITDTAANIASALDALNNLALVFTITSTNGPVVITDAQYHTDLTAIAALEQTVQQVLVVSNAPVADAATLQADQYVASFSIADTASAVAAQAAALNADTAVTAIAVTDTAANIATAFDALNTLSPALTISSTSGPVMITDAQYNTDMTAIAALEQTGGMLAVTGATVADVAALQADSNVASFAVTDTAANIAASFDALNADAKLTSITSSTGPVVLSSAQYYSDTSAIAKLAQTVEVLVVNNVTVADAATLQADQSVASFSIADTASAVAAQATALNADTALTAIAITDTAANIATAFDALNTLSPALTISSTSGPVMITDAQYHTDMTAIAALEQTGGMLAVTGATVADAAALQADSNVASFAVTDTAANIAANFDALNADTKVTAIASSTGPVVITDGQYHTDTAAIAMLAQTVEVVVVPNAPVADAATLQADQNVASFTIADTASAVAAQATALNADTALTAIAITDTAANIATALDTLNTLAPAFTITSTNGPVTITETQYQGDLTAIAALEQTGGMLAVTGATAVDAAALQADSNVASFTVADTAANIAANFDALNADTKVTAIASSTGPVVITDAQYHTDTAAIAMLAQTVEVVVVPNAPVADAAALQADQNVASFTIADTASAVAAQATALNADTALTAIAITDTAANIATALDTLNTLAPAFTITSTNGPVTITETQYQGDLTAIAALEQTGGMLAVTGATAADAAALQADSNVASFTVADTAANVVAALDGLQADSHLSSVSLTDSGTPTLTISATQFANDTAALDKLTGNYNLVVTGVSAAAVTSVEADSHVTSFSVSDTASNLVQNIASLSNASSVTLTGSNSVQLSQSEQLATLPGFTIASGASLTTAGLGVTDTTTGQALSALPQAYSGPVSGLTDQLIAVNSDNLNIAVTTDNWFLHSGSGEDALAVHGGTNVLDGGTGSNFLVGGTGSDTFFVDDRGASADIWSTVVNFHAGDSATVWGVTPQDFSINWVDGQGAAGYTGLTLHATATGQPTASITLAGLTSADLTNGTLSVQYGTVGGSNYMYIHHN